MIIIIALLNIFRSIIGSRGNYPLYKSCIPPLLTIYPFSLKNQIFPLFLPTSIIEKVCQCHCCIHASIKIITKINSHRSCPCKVLCPQAVPLWSVPLFPCDTPHRQFLFCLVGKTYGYSHSPQPKVHSLCSASQGNKGTRQQPMDTGPKNEH